VLKSEKRAVTEIYTPALALRREDRGDRDVAFTLYTKELGKILALAKSARKITSKLTGHLALGRIADVRVIDVGSFQLLDAFSSRQRHPGREILKLLHFLDSMTSFGQPDLHIWHIARGVVYGGKVEPVVYRELLRIMGFVPGSAVDYPRCAGCREGQRAPAFFYLPDMVLLCSDCARDVRIDEDDVVQIV